VPGESKSFEKAAIEPSILSRSFGAN